MWGGEVFGKSYIDYLEEGKCLKNTKMLILYDWLTNKTLVFHVRLQTDLRLWLNQYELFFNEKICLNSNFFFEVNLFYLVMFLTNIFRESKFVLDPKIFVERP